MNIGKRSVNFKAERDIPSLSGKVILVTGGNIGLGKQRVLEYTRHDASQIWSLARNISKANLALQEIKSQLPKTSQTDIKILELDVSSLASVKKAAHTFTAASSRLDTLMLNAGVMAASPGLNQDGYELQLGTDYLGHALLARILLPVLDKTTAMPNADVTIIMLSSHGHMYAPKSTGVNFSTLRTKADELGPYTRYGQSKLAMILWVKKMTALYPQFTLASIHPGVVRTNLMNGATGSSLAIRLLGKVANDIVMPVDQGVGNQLWASVGQVLFLGLIMSWSVLWAETDVEKDMELAERLWEWTEGEIQAWVVG